MEPKYVRLRLPDEPPYTSASEDMKLAKGIKEPKKEEDKETSTEDAVENISDRKKKLSRFSLIKRVLVSTMIFPGRKRKNVQFSRNSSYRSRIS